MKLSAKAVDEMATATVECIKRTVEGPRIAGRFEALEARIAALEAKPPTVEYAGVFDEQKTYKCGQLVTRRGGLWLAQRETSQTPGMDPQSWRLVVKEGRAE